jgi:hypothetical protein
VWREAWWIRIKKAKLERSGERFISLKIKINMHDDHTRLKAYS